MYSQIIMIQTTLTRVYLGIIFFGFLGSIISYIVFSRKVFQKCTIAFYCKSLAVVDQFTMVTLIIGVASEITNVPILNKFDFVCKTLTYITIGISGIPGWIMVFFSLDQYFTIAYPNQSEFWKKRSFQYSLLVISFLFHTVTYIPIIFTAYVAEIQVSDNETQSACLENMPDWLGAMYVIDVVLPFTIMIVTTCLVLRTIYVTRKNLQKLIAPLSESSTFQPIDTIRLRDMKFSFNSVALNLTFIVLMGPSFSQIFTKPQELIYASLFQTIAALFFFMNFASHFWIYFGVNSMFRGELLIILRIRKN